MAAEKVNIFTAAMRAEFLQAFMATADVAPIESCYQVIDSSARIEHYAWMSPTPALAQYKGHRRFGKISEIDYKVENLEYDAAFEVLLRDIEDDQVGGYKLKPQELAERARKFPNRLVLQQLAAGESKVCFDGSNFFADSHVLGTGDNILTGTGSSNADGLTYRLIALIKDKAIKPLVYQNRKPPRFETDSGTAQSLLAKHVKYWIDMESAAAFGHWWDACIFKFTNLPTINEVQDAIRDISTRVRGFRLPKSLESDSEEYVHEQLQFSPKTVSFITSTGIYELVRTVMDAELVTSTGGSAVTNVYRGYGDVITTAFLD